MVKSIIQQVREVFPDAKHKTAGRGIMQAHWIATAKGNIGSSLSKAGAWSDALANIKLMPPLRYLILENEFEMSTANRIFHYFRETLNIDIYDVYKNKANTPTAKIVVGCMYYENFAPAVQEIMEGKWDVIAFESNQLDYNKFNNLAVGIADGSLPVKKIICIHHELDFEAAIQYVGRSMFDLKTINVALKKVEFTAVNQRHGLIERIKHIPLKDRK